MTGCWRPSSLQLDGITEGDGLRTSLYDYCMERGQEDLLWQWHPIKNEPATPYDVSYGSKRKVWWRCEKGHEWQAIVYTRTDGANCPYCAGKLAWPGENDLASQRPDLAAQWHPMKNGSVRPDRLLLGSHYKAWWICAKGHEWQAVVKSRTNGCGCPVCANRSLVAGENDLAVKHPELAQQWNAARNGTLTPRDLVAGSHRKVWWKCAKGHEWQASVVSRVHGAGCPVCAGKMIVPGENDLASRFPDIAAQWHPEKNAGQTPDRLSPYSNCKVWWRCELGHAYQAMIAARTSNGSGCPYCAGKKVLLGFNDLATTEPLVAKQWHPTLNGTLTPKMVTAGSHKKVWWQCPDGHVWKAVIHSRAGPQKCGCPVCAGRVKPGRRPWYIAAAAHEQAADCV